MHSSPRTPAADRDTSHPFTDQLEPPLAIRAPPWIESHVPSCWLNGCDPLLLGLCPCEPMARAAAYGGHSPCWYAATLLLVAGVFVGGIACFAVSSTQEDPFIDKGAAVSFAIGWALSACGPVWTVLFDLVVWLAHDLPSSPGCHDEDVEPDPIGGSSRTLVVVHASSQIAMYVLMGLLICDLESRLDTRRGICHAVYSCCCPCLSLVEAMRATRRAREAKQQQQQQQPNLPPRGLTDELPAYQV